MKFKDTLAAGSMLLLLVSFGGLALRLAWLNIQLMWDIMFKDDPILLWLTLVFLIALTVNYGVNKK